MLLTSHDQDFHVCAQEVRDKMWQAMGSDLVEKKNQRIATQIAVGSR